MICMHMEKHTFNTELLGERLRELRKARGLSQSDLSMLSKVPQTTIHKIEAGTTVAPRVDTLQQIADALDTSMYELVGFARTELVGPAQLEERGSERRTEDDPIKELVGQIAQQNPGLLDRSELSTVEEILRGFIHLGEEERAHVRNQIQLLLRIGRTQPSTQPASPKTQEQAM